MYTLSLLMLLTFGGHTTPKETGLVSNRDDTRICKSLKTLHVDVKKGPLNLSRPHVVAFLPRTRGIEGSLHVSTGGTLTEFSIPSVLAWSRKAFITENQTSPTRSYPSSGLYAPRGGRAFVTLVLRFGTTVLAQRRE